MAIPRDIRIRLRRGIAGLLEENEREKGEGGERVDGLVVCSD